MVESVWDILAYHYLWRFSRSADVLRFKSLHTASVTEEERDGIASLPTELLTRIMYVLEPKDRLSMLLTCRSIYSKCIIGFYSMTPLRLKYDGTKEAQRRCNTTMAFLENQTSVVETIQAMLYCRKENEKLARKVYNPFSVPSFAPSVPPLSLMTGLVTLTIEVTSVSDLAKVISSIPTSLKRLVLVLDTKTAKGYWKDFGENDLQQKPLQIRYLSVISKKTILGNSVHASLLSLLPINTLNVDVYQRYFQNSQIRMLQALTNKRSRMAQTIGSLIARVITAARQNIISIELQRFDAALVFCNEDMDSAEITNLRLLFMDSTSKIHLSFWMNNFEKENCEKRKFQEETSFLMPSGSPARKRFPLVVCVADERQNKLNIKTCSDGMGWTKVSGNTEKLLTNIKTTLGLMY